MLRTFFTIDFRFLGNFGPDLEKSLIFAQLPSAALRGGSITYGVPIVHMK